MSTNNRIALGSVATLWLCAFFAMSSTACQGCGGEQGGVLDRKKGCAPELGTTHEINRSDAIDFASVAGEERRAFVEDWVSRREPLGPNSIGSYSRQVMLRPPTVMMGEATQLLMEPGNDLVLDLLRYFTSREHDADSYRVRAFVDLEPVPFQFFATPLKTDPYLEYDPDSEPREFFDVELETETPMGFTSVINTDGWERGRAYDVRIVMLPTSELARLEAVSMTVFYGGARYPSSVPDLDTELAVPSWQEFKALYHSRPAMLALSDSHDFEEAPEAQMGRGRGATLYASGSIEQNAGYSYIVTFIDEQWAPEHSGLVFLEEMESPWRRFDRHNFRTDILQHPIELSDEGPSEVYFLKFHEPLCHDREFFGYESASVSNRLLMNAD